MLNCFFFTILFYLSSISFFKKSTTIHKEKIIIVSILLNDGVYKKIVRSTLLNLELEGYREKIIVKMIK